MEGLYTASTLPARYIQCGLCTKTIKQPRTVCCLHSFCHECLLDYIDRNKNEYPVTCPECNTEIFSDAGSDVNKIVSRLPENTLLQRMVKTVTSLTEENKNCDICLRAGRFAHPALNWCCDCSDALCESCGEIHLCTTITSSHDVLPTLEAREKPLALLLKRKCDTFCKTHEGQIVNLFCQNCSMTVCAHCVAAEHKMCGKYVPISQSYKTHEEELDCLSGKLDTVDRFVTKANNVLVEENDSFHERIECIREEIRAISKLLCERIQKSEQELLTELEKWRSQTAPRLTSGISKMAECADRVKKSREVISTILLYGSESEIMSSLCLIREQTAQTEKSAYRDVATHHKQPDISFQPSLTTTGFIQAFETLGEIKVNESQQGNAADHCGCWGVACVSREDIIVVDGANKAICKFRRGGSLVDQIAVSDEPRDVTHIAFGEIAVTQNRKQILFLTTTRNIELKRKIKTEKSYHGIASMGADKLVVSYLGGRKSVDIISVSGKILRSISTDEQGKSLFLEPRFVTTTKGDNQLVLASDFRQQSIIALTPGGIVKFKFQTKNGHRGLSPLGICADRLGNVFVADYSKDEIVLLNLNGKYQRSVVTREDDVEKPVAIDISRDGRLVLIQNDGMVRVFSY